MRCCTTSCSPIVSVRREEPAPSRPAIPLPTMAPRALLGRAPWDPSSSATSKCPWRIALHLRSRRPLIVRRWWVVNSSVAVSNGSVSVNLATAALFVAGRAPVPRHLRPGMRGIPREPPSELQELLGFPHERLPTRSASWRGRTGAGRPGIRNDEQIRTVGVSSQFSGQLEGDETPKEFSPTTSGPLSESDRTV